MKRINSTQSNRRGFTLTEIAIVLGIVGLILGAIWVAAAAVYNNLRVSHANTQVLQIAQAVRALYATSNTIAAGDQTSALISAGAVPTDMVNGTTLLSAWAGGQTYIIGNGAQNGFSIIMTAVPQNACINLLVGVGGANADPGLYDASAVASAAGAASDAINATTRVAGVTPALAGAAAANNMGGCTGQTSYKVKFGFSLKS